jgi:hypothetical protein
MVMPEIKFKRGLKSKLPNLDVAEPGFTTDTEELFIGSEDGNIQIAKQIDLNTTNENVTHNTNTLNNLANVNANAEVMSARGTYPLLGNRLDGVDALLADLATVNNHTITYGYDTNGNIQTVTEKDSSNNVIKTVSYTYNNADDVATSVTVMSGKTVTTTYNYDTTGNITSTTNVIS